MKHSRIGQPEDFASTWFAMLEVARLDDDHKRAAAALRELERLGVHVSFRRPQRKHNKNRVSR